MRSLTISALSASLIPALWTAKAVTNATHGAGPISGLAATLTAAAAMATFTAVAAPPKKDTR